MAASFEEEYEIGLPVFQKLFEMKKDELVQTVKDICEPYAPSDDFFNDNISVYVTKTIVDDSPSEIFISAYNNLIISPFGINIKVHGITKNLVRFNKYFTLNQ
jgi:hypothetical protein